MKESGFPVHRVGDPAVSVQVVDGPFGSDLKVDEYLPEGVPLLRVSNCRSGRIEVNDELVYISEKKHAELIRSEVLPGDVLLTKAGAILGYSAVFPVELKRGNITSHLASIRPAAGIESRYLSEFLSSSIGIQQIYRWGNKSTRPELNTDEVRALEVVVPPLEKQRELVAAMNAARAKRRLKLAQAETLLADLDGFVLDTVGLTPGSPPSTVFGIRSGDLLGMLNPNRYRAMHLEKHIPVASRVGDVGAVLDARCRPEKDGPNEIWDWIRIDDLPNQPWEVETLRTEPGANINGLLFEVQEDDILIARLGPTILNAKFVLCPKTVRRTVASGEFLVLRCNKNWQPTAVLWLLRTKLYRDIMYLRSRGGTPSRYRLDSEDLEAIPFPTLDASLQTAITAEVQRCNESSRRLRYEAEAGWQAAKRWFEGQLLGPVQP